MVDKMNIFKTKKNKINLPIQLDLFPNDHSRNSHIMMGLFYENLSICLLGGRSTGKRKIDMDIDGIHYGIKPDVIDDINKKITESKAMRAGHQLALLDDQVKRYEVFHSLYPAYEINFVIWRHQLKAIKSYSSSFDILIEELCQKTIGAVILPFSLISKIHKSKNFKRYEKTDKCIVHRERYSCTRIGSAFINSIFETPSFFFRETECDRMDYELEYFESPEILFNDNIVEPFPIARIFNAEQS
jgi:hypothetical protein